MLNIATAAGTNRSVGLALIDPSHRREVGRKHIRICSTDRRKQISSRHLGRDRPDFEAYTVLD